MILLEDDLLDWKNTQRPLVTREEWEKASHSAAGNGSDGGGGESKSEHVRELIPHLSAGSRSEATSVV